MLGGMLGGVLGGMLGFEEDAPQSVAPALSWSKHLTKP
jgi:hypothetical protein